MSLETLKQAAARVLLGCRPGPNGCLEWQGPYFKWGGYGRILINGKQRRTHRTVFEAMHGPQPASVEVCHRCDNPKCCEPTHLFGGTHAENMADMAAKGRATKLKGEDSPNSVLTAAAVDEIRARLRAKQPPRVIAAAFNVAESTVKDIAAGKTWNHA